MTVNDRQGSPTVTERGEPSTAPSDGAGPTDAVGREKAGTFTAFAAAVVRSPLAVGTAFPSGRYLGRRLAAVVPDGAHCVRPPVVLEVGAGTGSITDAIVARAGSRARVIAVEKDPGMAAALDGRGLGVDVVAADADTVPTILAERGLDRVDAIVSALPWTLFPSGRRRQLLEALRCALHPTGVFTTACYSYGLWVPAAQQFRKELTEVFDEVLPTRTVWRNTPPAMTYVCRRPVGPRPD